ncbi:MAG TPA: polysaccharide deacetylase, partial [Lachnospiraceae bacterium]|nr:polysaccharide deacetylase [Lachnospiraceae bacterium]
DFSVPGEQKVAIQLKDEGNNTSEVEALLIVKEDTEAPKILGVRDKTAYIGDSLSYRKGITVTDNKDKKVELQIDSSNVNLKKEGTYSVIYTAVDSSGNKA